VHPTNSIGKEPLRSYGFENLNRRCHADICSSQVENLRQHVAGLEHEHSMERNQNLATIQELQGQVSHLQAHPPQQEGPKLHALQRELAILEEANQKLQADLRKKEDELIRNGGGSRAPGGKGGDELQSKDADLRRANVIIDIKTQELARLKQELDMADAKEREAVGVAMRAEQQLNEAMMRIDMLEQSGGGSEGLNMAMHRANMLEREKAESEQAMRELITETNGKAKTIADLLALQEDMVAELDGMRRDLTRMGQQKEALENEKRLLEETVSRYHMMGTQKEVLENEKKQLEEALYRYVV
jgi:hypothetical protein